MILDPGKQRLLSQLPSVDELLKSEAGIHWLSRFRRRAVIQGIREVLAGRRRNILSGPPPDLAREALEQDILDMIGKFSSFSLLPVINATGVVIHTNLGRAVLSEKVLENAMKVGAGYSNLEYDLETGKRGKRHSHTEMLLKEITGAESGFLVNNNAAAVLLCLSTLARGREVLVSRGELVEIGGSFRVPDVMTASGAILREVGTTNKTHLSDYTKAVGENTGLILKVHRSNYKITGFTEDVGIEQLVSLGARQRIPVMYDLGSGCLLDLRPSGIYDEPSVQEIVKSGVDLLTFSGDKLLGGPQGGVIVGKKAYIGDCQKNPLARALRVDKLTIAAFEATLSEYMEPDNAKREIPVLNMLFQSPGEIKTRARQIASALRKQLKNGEVGVIEDVSRAGGGSLPEAVFPTFVVSIRPELISVNELESRLRNGSPPVIARIKEGALLLDARTIRRQEIIPLARAVVSCLSVD